MHRVAQQRQAARPDTADKFTEEDAERNQYGKLEFLLEMGLMAMRVSITVMVMMVVAVVVQSVSLKVTGNLAL